MLKTLNEIEINDLKNTTNVNDDLGQFNFLKG